MKVPGVPSHPFLAATVCLALAPVVARLPGIAFAGVPWLTAYLPLALVNVVLILAPAGLVGASGMGPRGRPLVYWTMLAIAFGVLAELHGVQRLSRGDSPAIGFVLIAFMALATVAALVAWPVAAFLDRRLRPAAKVAALCVLAVSALAFPAWHTVERLAALPAPVDVYMKKAGAGG